MTQPHFSGWRDKYPYRYDTPDMHVSCEVCGCVLSTKLALKAHYYIRHHGDIRQECAVCGKTYIGASYLKRHYGSRHPEFQTEWNVKKESSEILPPKQN